MPFVLFFIVLDGEPGKPGNYSCIFYFINQYIILKVKNYAASLYRIFQEDLEALRLAGLAEKVDPVCYNSY